MKEKVLQALTTRRSVRSYQKTQVDEQALQEILEAGRYAATGRGLQSPLMIVVQDTDVREQLRRMNAEIMGTPDADPFYGAPTIIIVLADRSVPTCVEDGSLVLGNPAKVIRPLTEAEIETNRLSMEQYLEMTEWYHRGGRDWPDGKTED
jgi:nitroreductase